MSKIISPVATVLIAFAFFSCSGTRYITDQTTIDRQHEMQRNRAGGNVADVCINFANMAIAAILNSDYQVYSSERSFRKIAIVNASADTMRVNMVTDIVWKSSGYCDIMGIVLPPEKKQTILVPYPAAYNVYFKKPSADEEMIEVRTDNKHRRIKLSPGMTLPFTEPADKETN